MKTIIRAPHSGFCFGVKQAIEKAEAEALRCEGERIHSRGFLIHNQKVIQRLQGIGIDVIEDLAEAKRDDTIIVRSHGEPKEFYLEAAERGLRVVDATCN